MKHFNGPAHGIDPTPTACQTSLFIIASRCNTFNTFMQRHIQHILILLLLLLIIIIIIIIIKTSTNKYTITNDKRNKRITKNLSKVQKTTGVPASMAQWLCHRLIWMVGTGFISRYQHAHAHTRTTKQTIINTFKTK